MLSSANAGPSTASSFFFFQAEDGIRDLYVTGVQTCALPIYLDRGRGGGVGEGADRDQPGSGFRVGAGGLGCDATRRLDCDLRSRASHPRGHALRWLIIDQDRKSVV